MAERLIGIDAGGTMTKAAIFDAKGHELACERRPNQMLFPAPGHTERDPDHMWRAACEAIAVALEVSGTAPGDVAAISLSGYGAGLYVVDAEGDPVRPGIVSTDTRANALVAAWEADGRARRNGLLVQQRLWSGQPPALLAWLCAHEPESLSRAHSITFCKDFLRRRLCGDHSTDESDAGIAGLIDVTRAAYAEDLFHDLGIEAWLDKLPAIAPATEVVGGVQPSAARLTGLKEGTPVVRGLVDVSASALASGSIDESRLIAVAGTFSINQTLHRAPRLSKLPFLQSAYPVDGLFLATEGGATSASNLEWVCKRVLGAEAERAEAAGRSIYDVCNALVADSLDRPNDILFFPFLFGGPGGAPAGLLGMTAGNDLADVVRAVYEGVAFAHKSDIDALMTGPDAAKPRVVRLAGGASRSPVWAQIFADVLGLPVETTESSELGALGVAMTAAVAVGLVPDLETAVARMVRLQTRFEPRPERSAAYAKKYRRYSETAEVLGGLWA
ncbi:MAG: FGGY-family carbohydrate kinase [Rhodospirillales bacterium]